MVPQGQVPSSGASLSAVDAVDAVDAVATSDLLHSVAAVEAHPV